MIDLTYILIGPRLVHAPYVAPPIGVVVIQPHAVAVLFNKAQVEMRFVTNG
jgi:hypothetical protein